MQGHLYNLRNVRLRFSEPTTEPIPDSKLRITLGETVQNSTSPPAGAVHLGGVTAIGMCHVLVDVGRLSLETLYINVMAFFLSFSRLAGHY